MTREEFSVNLDKSFLEQQSVRKLLNLFEKKSETLTIEQLLEVAKAVIKSELIKCNCSENALVSLKLECQIANKESENLKERYTVEWTDSDQTSPLEGSFPSPRIPDNFYRKLLQRLDAELPKDRSLLSASMNFREAEEANSDFECTLDEGDGYKYWARRVNGVLVWWKPNNVRERCGRGRTGDIIVSN